MAQTSAPKGMRHIEARCTECTDFSRANYGCATQDTETAANCIEIVRGTAARVRSVRSSGTLGREDMIAVIMEKLKEANALGKPMVFCALPVLQHVGMASGFSLRTSTATQVKTFSKPELCELFLTCHGTFCSSLACNRRCTCFPHCCPGI